MGSSKGGGGEVTIGHHYAANFLVTTGIAAPRSQLLEIKWAGRTVWKGSFEGAGSVAIEEKEILGGEGGEGGLSGIVDVMPGGKTQPVNPALLSAVSDALGRSYVPGYRNLTCYFFRGFMSVDLTGTPWENVETQSGIESHQSLVDAVYSSVSHAIKDGVRAFRSFYYAAMNHYFKGLAIKELDIWDDWYPEKVLVNGCHNPAHIFHMILTHPTLGRGFPLADINDANFRESADRFYDEGMGLGFEWNTRGDVKDLIEFLQDHVNGNLNQNRRTGQWELNLVRDDYDPESLFELNESNCKVLDFQRRSNGRVVNEVVVNYTRPDTGEPDSITVQALSSLASQGGRIETETRDYIGFQDPGLAARAGARDLATLINDLAQAELRCNREVFDLYPGDVVKLNYPSKGISSIILRIGKMNMGQLTAGTIIISAVEDVFGLPSSAYVAEPESGWKSPNKAPEPVAAYKFYEPSYYELYTQTTAAQRAEWPDDVGFTAVAALSPNSDADTFKLLDETTGVVVDTGEFAPSGVVVTSVGYMDETIPIDSVTFKRISVLQNGGLCWWDDELIKILGFDSSTSVLTVRRAVIDTIPQEHAAGSRLFAYMETENAFDPTIRVEFESTNYKLLTRTSQGVLAPGDAATVPYVTENRQGRPYPPGKIQIAGQFFPASVSGPTVSITWANRNREQQTAYVPYWTENSVTLPAGVQTHLIIDDQSGNVVDTLLTDDHYDLVLSGSETELRVRLFTVEGGVESWRKFDHTVSIV